MSGVPAQLWINLFADAAGAIRCHAAHPGQDAAHAEVDDWDRGLVWRGSRYLATLWSVRGRAGERRFGMLDLTEDLADWWTGLVPERAAAALPSTTAAG